MTTTQQAITANGTTTHKGEQAGATWYAACGAGLGRGAKRPSVFMPTKQPVNCTRCLKK